MANIIQVSDLPTDLQSAPLIEEMVDAANAKASRVAPCLAAEPTNDQLSEARLLLIGMVKRWTEAGSGALSQMVSGPFSASTDTRQRTGFNMWPSEIRTLQAICGTDTSGAYSIDTAPNPIGIHLRWCSLSMGASYCSCGVDIAGEPIYELG